MTKKEDINFKIRCNCDKPLYSTDELAKRYIFKCGECQHDASEVNMQSNPQCQCRICIGCIEK